MNGPTTPIVAPSPPMTTTATLAGLSELLERARGVADAWDAHVAAVEACNAARPNPDVTLATRAEYVLHDERFHASNEAQRAMYSAAQDFAKWASENRAALTLKENDCGN